MEALLTTERLLLRNLCAADVEAVHDYRNNADCARYQRWEDTSEQSIRAFISQWAYSAFPSLEEEQHYAICLREGGLVGDLSCFYNGKDRCITLGFTISYRHQRNGYAFELLSAVVAVLRERYPQLELVALVEKENTASLRLVEKLGFRQECYAERIDSYIYTIS